MNYKFTDASNSVVADGQGWSGLVTAQEVQAWMDAGNTPEPADVPPPPTPLQKIVEIEVANPVTHRMLRDLTLAVGEIAASVTGKEPTENPAVRDIQALEADIAVLRAQAKAQGLIP